MTMDHVSSQSPLAGLCAHRRIDLAEPRAAVWTLLLDDPAMERGRLEALLCAEERARAARFHQEADRIRYVVARAALRLLLGAELAMDPAALSFAAGPHGKPTLIRVPDSPDLGPSPRVGFNVAHSGDRALIALSDGRDVGVDVERLAPDRANMRIAKKSFSAREYAGLGGLRPANRVAGFFRIWTRKEAVVKALGGGLTLPLDAFDVSLEPGDQDALLDARAGLIEPSHWRLMDIAMDPGYVAALCIARNVAADA